MIKFDREFTHFFSRALRLCAALGETLEEKMEAGGRAATEKTRVFVYEKKVVFL